MSVDGPAIVLLADAAPQRGIGHAVRASTLAFALRNQGARVEVMGRGLGFIREVEPQFDTLNLGNLSLSDGIPASVKNIVQYAPDLVITDGYFYPTDFYRALAREGVFYGVVEDNAESQAEEPLLVINQNPNASSDEYKKRFPSSDYFLGLDFAIIRPSARIGYPSSGQSDGSVFVLIGGSDPKQLSLPLAHRLAKERKEMKIAIGPAVTGREKIVKELQALPGLSLPRQADIPQAMASSSVCILAGGTSLWEANYMAKPVVGLAVADNQVTPLRAAKRARVVAEVVDARIDDPHSVADNVVRILGTLSGSKGSTALRQVDGFGADRLAVGILGTLAQSERDRTN